MMRWLRTWIRTLSAQDVTMPSSERFDLADTVRGCEGKWVAIRPDGTIAEVADTPYRLTMMLHEREIRDASILRVPSEDEPELVGFG